MTKKLLFIMLVCTVATSAWAAEIQWFGGATPDRNWTTAGNWNSNVPPGGPVPGLADKAKLNYVWANPGPIISTPGVGVGEIFISEDRDVGTVGEQSLTIATGGVLNTGNLGGGYAGQVILGYWGADDRVPLPANEGRLIMAGGTATIGPAGGFGGHLFVGFSGIGHLQVDAGTLKVTNMFGLGWNGGTGTVDISGGLLNTEQYNFNNGTYSFNFSELRAALGDGEWVQNHYWKIEIQALVDAGKITTSVPGAYVKVDWDPVLEQTHVYAIPEPVSIVMLGLGALLLRKRS